MAKPLRPNAAQGVEQHRRPERELQDVGVERADGPLERRVAQVRESIAATGTYEHTFAELTWGARVAWRNAARCIGRLYWRIIPAPEQETSMTSRTQRSRQERQARSRAAQLLANEPLLRGTLVLRLRSCGKSYCRCQRGQKHPALYLYTRTIALLGAVQAAFFELATRLTPDPARQAGRAVHAAQASGCGTSRRARPTRSST